MAAAAASPPSDFATRLTAESAQPPAHVDPLPAMSCRSASDGDRPAKTRLRHWNSCGEWQLHRKAVIEGALRRSTDTNPLSVTRTRQAASKFGHDFFPGLVTVLASTVSQNTPQCGVRRHWIVHLPTPQPLANGHSSIFQMCNVCICHSGIVQYWFRLQTSFLFLEWLLDSASAGQQRHRHKTLYTGGRYISIHVLPPQKELAAPTRE